MRVKFQAVLLGVLVNHGSYFQIKAESAACASSGKSECFVEETEGGFSRNEGQDIADWIVSEGGFVDSRQEIRRVFPDDPHSINGVFAKDRIEKGELLLSIPYDLLIRSEMDRKYYHRSYDYHCKLVKNLSTEMKLGDDSKYAPYIKYLNGQGRGLLIDDFSNEAIDLFDEIIYPVMPWFRFEDISTEEMLKHDCSIENDPVAVLASCLVEMRSEDDLMIPFYDMYNHRNGKWLNTWIDLKFGESFDVYARKTIETGQQIYNSYNQCNKCDLKAQRFEMGTMHIYQAYGFVEDFPQRWFFGSDLKFDLDKQIGTDELKVSWSNMENLPTADDVDILFGMINHVKAVKEYYKKDDFLEISESEWTSIMDFQEALLVALESAYISADDIAKGGIGYY